MRTRSLSTEEARRGRRWFHVDAADRVVGRLASEIAHVLRGKHRVGYTPHADVGDFVIVTHAEKVVFTGRKNEQKVYHRHTGHPGGIVSRTPRQLRERQPTLILERAVWGMMPKGPLGRQMFGKLKIYAGGEHPHAAQCPRPIAEATQQPEVPAVAPAA